ncbi:type II toxin-antitoxin system VapB family antitoxin [Kineococcus sp. SYSU DK006]|uniref:type II toxin-antitoxin system VapB family antitoxin n=1 Tax=Kineococcus sp. SYSU DK006 TaxID=3383127 RepID=UPI003D7E2B5B
MSKTHIDIDEDLLARVAQITGTSTKRETVEAALQLALRHDQRRAAVERLIARGRSGYFATALQEHPKPAGHEDIAARSSGSREQDDTHDPAVDDPVDDPAGERAVGGPATGSRTQGAA